jgi:gliding motility-associated-like protein
MISLRSYVLVAVMVSLFANLALAIDAPEIVCVALDENDDIKITWEIPVDSNNEFTSYIIYYQDGGGVFNPFSTITNYNQTSAILVGTFSGTGSFYIKTSSNGGVDLSGPSNIVSPLLVNLFSSGRKVELLWNELDLASSDSVYRIYRKIDVGNWKLIGTSDWDNRSFLDTVNQCKSIVKYRIEFFGRTGCLCRSNVASVLIKDENPPKQSNLICASVDTASGAVNLEWDASSSIDAFGYLIFYFDDFIYSDTSFGPSKLTYNYEHDEINGLIKSETLSIAPFDSCFDSTTMWYNQAADSLRFRTLFVDSIDFDRCAGKIGLKWNMSEDGFPVGVRNATAHRVYRQENNGPSVLRASLSAVDSVFIDSGLVSGNRYRYVIGAYNANLEKQALSNVFDFKIRPTDGPDYLFVSNIVNNHETDLNHVIIRTDTTSEAVEYGLFRSLSEFGGYQLVERSNKLKRDSFEIIDPSGSPSQTDYYYEVRAFDYCGDSIMASRAAKSLIIEGFKDETEYYNELLWSDYVGFQYLGSQIDHYQLVRLTNGSQRDTVFKTSRSFIKQDTIYELEYINGDVCYYVEALESNNNIFGYAEAARSNLVCLDYSPRVFIPNAFTPDEDFINDVFLPDVNFIEILGYKLSVFDRAGNLIYVTTDPTKGWDGQGEGIGVYAYFLQLQNARGEGLNFSGKVSLIR